MESRDFSDSNVVVVNAEEQGGTDDGDPVESSHIVDASPPVVIIDGHEV